MNVDLAELKSIYEKIALKFGVDAAFRSESKDEFNAKPK